MALEIDTDNGGKPLQGVVLCCTALPQDVRDKLAISACEMGAIHKLDLTSDVTHLIVGNITTPKYRYVAKERPDIKVLHPNWIEAVRVPWMDGTDVDIADLESQHQLRAFHNLQICVTGFEDIDQRNAISTRVEEEGATYHGDLTKVVTHLVAAVPQGKKYAAARSWGIAVVSQKWYDDSLLRGMALDERMYDPLMPEEDQGKGAFRLVANPRTSLGKRGTSGNPESATDAKKRLRRSTSTRLESQSQDMWQDLSAQTVDVDRTEVDQWTEREGPVTQIVLKEPPMARRSISQFPDRTKEDLEGLFSSIHILLHGFDSQRTERLLQYLEPNGARIVKTTLELEDASTVPFFKQRCLLVPHDATELTLPDVPATTMTATEWWVERCIHHKRLFDPNDDVLSTPLLLSGASGLNDVYITTTGFSSVDLRQAAKAVTMLGGTYQEMMQPTTTVLVCATTSVKKEKAFYAQKYSMPVVSAAWLWESLRQGVKAPYAEYKIRLPFSDGTTPGNDAKVSNDGQLREAKSRPHKKDEPSMRLSNTRRKQATPSLPLQASRPTPPPVATKPQPFIHEDNDDEMSLDSGMLPPATVKESSQRVSQPLQERSPNGSPRKITDPSKPGKDEASQDGYEWVDAQPAPPDHPASPESLPANMEVDEQASSRPRPGLDADISDLLLHRSAGSRPTSASDLQKRKHRPLGRAPSGISHRSVSASNQSGHPSPLQQSDELSCLPEEVANSSREAPLPPSTQLGYETAEAEQHRLQMSKTMGTKLEDDGGMKRLASLGTVKDSATVAAAASVGNRVRGRHKAR